MSEPTKITVSEELGAAAGDPLARRAVVNRLRAEGHTVVTDPAHLAIQFLAADDAEDLLASRDFGAAVAMSMLALAGVTDGPLHDLWADMMFGKDGDEHQRIRRTVSKRFTPRAIERLRPTVEQIADDLVSRCEGEDPVDLWSRLSVPLVARAACAAVGFPDDDAERVTEAALRVGRAFGLLPADVVDDTAAAAEELVAYVDELIESDRVVDGSILADLLADDDVPLSASETRALAANLVFGGLESTAKAITSGIALLHDHREGWEALVADPATLAPTAAAETLRYFPPAPAVLRMATEDAECGGAQVPANTLAAASLDAVCRDPALFEDPDDFDVTRTPGRHFAFGAGPHYCLGANLALLAIEVAFATLATRHPRLELAAPSHSLPWVEDPFRGLVSLPVHLDPDPA